MSAPARTPDSRGAGALWQFGPRDRPAALDAEPPRQGGVLAGIGDADPCRPADVRGSQRRAGLEAKRAAQQIGAVLPAVDAQRAADVPGPAAEKVIRDVGGNAAPAPHQLEALERL